MGLRLTTKVQVSGWRFLLRRLEHAIVRRDTRMFDDPLQFYSRSIALGIVVAVLILAGAALLAYFKPQGKLGGTSLFTDRATNQLYVLLSGQLHPVYNLTSARLVLGNPANPATVKSSELSKLPMGQTVGIPGAPYATPVSAGSTSIWTLCDTVARADSTSPVVQTAVIAIPLEIDASIDPLQSHEAVLVSYQGETWIVTTKGRHAIDLTDRALTSSMGIPVTARPTPISEGMFNALPDMGPWQLPPIPAAGAPNSLGLPDDLVIGSVFQIHTDKGPPAGSRAVLVMATQRRRPVAAVNGAVRPASADIALSDEHGDQADPRDGDRLPRRRKIRGTAIPRSSIHRIDVLHRSTGRALWGA